MSIFSTQFLLIPLLQTGNMSASGGRPESRQNFAGTQYGGDWGRKPIGEGIASSTNFFGLDSRASDPGQNTLPAAAPVSRFTLNCARLP